MGSEASGWNLASIWERVADRFPDALAQQHGERTYRWAEFDRRANRLASTLIERGHGHQDKIAHYLYNCNEFLETTFGAFKAALVPVNTNYRYTVDELVYLWDNADVTAVVFHGCFADQCAAAMPRCPLIRTWLWVDDGSGPCPAWATAYEDAVAGESARVVPPWGRSGDDLYLLYTGGTTGFPKGVMWRQADVFGSLDGNSKVRLPDRVDWAAFDARLTKPGPRNLPAAPLMHGTGAFNAMWNLCLGGSITTLTSRHFDVVELLDTIDARQINGMSIVGDAFAKPMLRALDAEPQRWDISSLRVIVSSGVIWATATKQGLLRHNPRLVMVDTLGSSEAIGMAASTTTAQSTATTATFTLGPTTKVLTEDGREVTPGSGERGRVALRGYTPIGYYKDETKSASTFVVFHGERWSIPGDWAEVDADGTLRLFGRGSQCINTGGEKVFPEEVEEALKTHPAVHDAAVVGVPDERFGEAITALVELNPPAPGGTPASVTADQLVEHVRLHLARYKSPRHVLWIDSVGRAANGKLDYRRLRGVALQQLGITDPDAAAASAADTD